MATKCEPLSIWKVCVLVVGRWCITAVGVVADLVTGGRSGSDDPAAPPRRRMYGYLFSHDAPSPFKQRARSQRAWSDGGRYRLSTTDGCILVSRSGWVVQPAEVVSSRRWLLWTLFAVCVDEECLTLVARTGITAGWVGAG